MLNNIPKTLLKFFLIFTVFSFLLLVRLSSASAQVLYDCESGIHSCADGTMADTVLQYTPEPYCCLAVYCPNQYVSCLCDNGGQGSPSIPYTSNTFICPVGWPPTSVSQYTELCPNPKEACDCPGGSLEHDPTYDEYYCLYTSGVPSSDPGDDVDLYYGADPDAYDNFIEEFVHLLDETAIATTFYNFLFPIGVGFGIFGIAMAGYTYMTSEGRPDKIKDANERLTHAILGTLFIVLSLVILKLIITTLLGSS